MSEREKKTRDSKEIWEAKHGYKNEILNKHTLGKIWKAGDCNGGKEDTKEGRETIHLRNNPAFVRSIYPSWNLYIHGVSCLVD